MMNDLFNEYMSRRLNEIDLTTIKHKAGPAVTISRAAGCSSQKIAKLLAETINKLSKKNEWEVISKEILHESAAELQLHPDTIKSVFKAKDYSFFDEIMQAFLSPEYQMERKMRNTVVNVIHRFAIDGHKIILGRAGNIICADIPDSVHIRIDAPLDWKINRMMKLKNMTHDEAFKFIDEIDKNRQNFIRSIKGKAAQQDDYDIIINQSKFTTEQIIDIIITTLRNREILK